MSDFNRSVILALFGLFLILGPLANAQFTPIPAGVGNLGNGITDTWYTATGAGTTSTTDSFVNSFAGQSVAQGFGFPFGFGGFGCGLGAGFTPFASVGPFQTGVGGNWGWQDSAASNTARAQTFGLQPIGLAFGIPVAGPGGLVYT